MKEMGKLFAIFLLVIVLGGAAGAYFLIKGGFEEEKTPSQGGETGTSPTPTSTSTPSPAPTQAPEKEQVVKCCELLKIERMASSGLRVEYEIAIKRFFVNGSTESIIIRHSYWAEDLGDRYSLTTEMSPVQGLAVGKTTFVGYYSKDDLDLIEAYVLIENPQGQPFKQEISGSEFPSLCAKGASEYIEKIDIGQETITVPAGSFLCNVIDLLASDLPEPSRFWFSAEEGPLNGYLIKGFYRDDETEILIQLVSWSLP